MRHLPATNLCTNSAFDSFLADFNRRTLVSWAIVALLGFGDCKVLSFWLRSGHPSRSYNLGLYRASAEGEGVTKSLAIGPKVLSMTSPKAKSSIFRDWRMGSPLVSALVRRACWVCRMTAVAPERTLEVAPKRYINFEDRGCGCRDRRCQGACCLNWKSYSASF